MGSLELPAQVLPASPVHDGIKWSFIVGEPVRLCKGYWLSKWRLAALCTNDGSTI
jgi:hypothetical protein